MEEEFRIKRLAARDRSAAHGELARTYSSALLRYAAGILGDVEEAREIVADALFKAMNEARVFNPDFQIKAWLYRVVTNASFNALRDRKRRTAILTQDGAGFVLRWEADAETHVLENQTTRAVERLLGELSSDHAAILRLRYHEDLAYGEIARRLGVPIGTVMSRLSRAHDRLRELVLSDPAWSSLRTMA